MLEDHEIIDLFWQRSEKAIEVTQNKYNGLCMNIAYNILYSNEDAKECVNDTYLKVWNVIPPQKPNFLKAFIARICRNLSIDRYRFNHAQKRHGDKMDVLFCELEECIADHYSVEADYSSTEVTDAINIFLETCPKEERIIFMQRYWYCDSISTIAERYGFTEGKVKSRLFRMRQRLKTALEKEGIAV